MSPEADQQFDIHMHAGSTPENDGTRPSKEDVSWPDAEVDTGAIASQIHDRIVEELAWLAQYPHSSKRWETVRELHSEYQSFGLPPVSDVEQYQLRRFALMEERFIAMQMRIGDVQKEANALIELAMLEGDFGPQAVLRERFEQLRQTQAQETRPVDEAA